MKGLKDKLFSTNQDKLTEKAFKQSIAISVFGIILCMIALCSVTWAWFSADISSNANNIQSAYCDVTVSVANSGTAVDPVNGAYTLEKDKVYEIQIAASGTAKTAYCILNIGGNTYYTQQIPTTTTEINGITVPSSIVFYLKFSADTTVQVINRWGTADQVAQQFENDLYYVDLIMTDPATIVTEPPQTETPESTESSESTESGAPSPEVTE